jgi:hypothetical protein
MTTRHDIFRLADAGLEVFILEVFPGIRRLGPVKGGEPALGADHHLFPRDLSPLNKGPESFPDIALASHTAVVDGRVDEVASGKEGGLDGLHIKLIVGFVLGPQIGPQANGGGLEPHEVPVMSGLPERRELQGIFFCSVRGGS